MLKVLIVDDERKIVQLIMHLVNWADYGMEVAGSAGNGNTALRMIQELKPDLVITDIRMPSINGIDLVRKAKEAGSASYFVMVSGYSDFEYAQQAIKLGVEDYLLKPVTREDLENVLQNICEKHQIRQNARKQHEDLVTSLSQSRDKLKKDLLTSLLAQKNPSLLSKTSEEIAEEYDFHMDGDSITCLTAHLFIQTESESQDASDAIAYLISKIQQDLQNRMNGICQDTICIPDHKNVIFLLNYNKEDEDQIDDQLHKFHINLLNYQSMYPDIRLAICKGTRVERLSDFSLSYESCTRGLEHRFIHNDFLIPSIQKAPESRKTNIITEDNKKEIQQAIEMLSSGKLQEVLLDIHPKLTNLIETGSSVYQSVEVLCSVFLYGIHSLNIASVYDHISRESLLNCLDDYYSFQDAYVSLITHMCNIVVRCYEEKKNTEELPIRLARNYIQEHYSEPITLNDVSEVAGFSPAYFSTIFRKATGSTFMEYLTEVRINRAKSLLVTTTSDISEIGSLIGYNDTKYFTKQFKKATHVTPSEFRKIYR